MLSVAILSRQRYTSKGPVHLQALRLMVRNLVENPGAMFVD
jgi:hypothetical protein